MKLDVPFHVNRKNECGPIALQMVFEYFGEKLDFDKIRTLVDSEKSGVTWTVSLARTAAELGFNVEFYSTSLGFNPKNFELDYYKKECGDSDNIKSRLDKTIIECNRLGIKLEERPLELGEILEKINQDCIPIILINWHVVKGKEGYKVAERKN